MMTLKGWGRVLACVVLVGVLAAASSAEAQQIRVPGPAQFDRARVSGFLWRGTPSGVLQLDELAGVPGFENGVNVGGTLGVTEAENGWILEGNFGAAPRHRLLITYSQQENTGMRTFSFGGIGLPVFSAETTLTLTEFHTFYNFLFVATPRVEFGALGGVGKFRTRASIVSTVGNASGQIETWFPTIGGNLLVNPNGPVRGYVEWTGFPRVHVDELSGWQTDFVARVEAFVAGTYGVILGYRRYRLVLDEELENVGLDLTWSGLTVGGQIRF